MNDLTIERYRAAMLRERIADNEAVYGPGCRPELRERLAEHERTIASMTKPRKPRPRFEIVVDEFTVPCEHPLCDRLHQRFMEYSDDGRTRWHDAKRKQYVVWDRVTDQRAGLGEAFATKREARVELTKFLTNEGTA